MIHEISILIPTFNEVCLPQVRDLLQAASAVEGLNFEIIVLDDGSTDMQVVEENLAVNQFEHCRLMRSEKNLGRSAARNFLVAQARFEWLLFLDCNVRIPTRFFVKNYVSALGADVVSGGVAVAESPELEAVNLRYVYERKFHMNSSVAQKNGNAYQNFRTTNFLARRRVLADCPFDESISGYGYEDVLFGKSLGERKIKVVHVNNPVLIVDFDANGRYVEKMEEAMRTLYALEGELMGFSPLLALANRIEKWCLAPFVCMFFSKFGEKMRQRLVDGSPSVFLLNSYKLSYFLTLKQRRVGRI